MRNRLRNITAFTALAAAVVLAGVMAGNATGARVVEMGKANTNPKPRCGSKPTDSCFAVGSVTGFVSKLGDQKRPFVARKRGKIVAWSISMGSKPSNKKPPGGGDDAVSNLQFFQDLFGNERYGKNPVASIAVLKPQGKKARYTLRSKSPAVRLARAFGEETIFTLEKPLLIGPGQIVGLTVHTWAPNIIPQAGASERYAWRASRKKGECGSAAARRTKPHTKVDSTRQYGCKFNDRFFYKAFFVPKAANN